MPEQYKYLAVSESGAMRRGTISALGVTHVEEFLNEQNLHPVRISLIRQRRPLSFLGFVTGSFYENLIMFTNSLATLHRAGVPLLRALSVIKIGSVDSRFNHVIDQLRMNVQAGRSLSEAMAEYDDIFSPVYVASVSAGEESGRLEQTLDELSSVLEREMELTRQVKVATRYPLIVVLVIIAAMTVLMTFVVPRFVNFYASFGAQLPLPTRVLIGLSNFVARSWPFVLPLAVLLIVGFRKLISTDRGRFWYDRQLLRLPAMGDIILKGNVARLALMFRILFNAGIPIVKSLDLLASVVKNSVISRETRKLGEIFQKGGSINTATDKFQFFPDLALNMMAIGMESGSVDRMMEEIGNHYSKEVFYRSRQLTSVLEPILTIVLGIFVLVIALAIFLPMWSLIRVFQGG